MRALSLAFLALGSISVAACTSLLGDFSSGGPGSASEGGADDSGGADGTTLADGGGDAPGSGEGAADASNGDAAATDARVDSGIPLVPLKCTTWKLPQPFLVQSLDGMAGSSNGDFNGITSFAAGPTTTRVVGGRYGATLFSVYGIDSSQSPPKVTSVDAPYVGVASSAYVQSVRRLSNGFGVVVSYQDSKGFIDVDLYPFRDASPISPLPAPVRLSSTQGVSSNVQSAVLEVAPSTYFVVETTQDTTTSTSALQIGLSSGGAPANMLTIDTSMQSIFGGLTLAHVGSSVFIYVIGSGGPAFYQANDTASSSMPRQAIARTAGSGSLVTGEFTDSVAGSSPSTTNLGYIELDTNEAGTAFGAFQLQAAAVPNAKLPSLTTSDISFGKTYTDLASVPGPTSPGRFFGDDYVAISPGLDLQSNATSWVNFLWLDMHGVVRGEQSGINGILQGRGNIISQNGPGMGASPGPRTAAQAAWNVVWSEQDRDDAGLFYNSLYYNELDCVP